MAGPFLGVDIGATAVRAVELRGTRDNLTLSRIGQVTLPPGAVREGEVADPELVTQALNTLRKEFGFKGRKAAIGIASQQVVVRQVELPQAPEEQLRESLAFQVQDYIPINVADAVLDFTVLEEGQDQQGNPVARILLVAAARAAVDNTLAVVRAAKFTPVMVDLDAFAVLRSIGWTQDVPAGEGEMLLDIGAEVTNIIVHGAGTPRFVRILLLGGGHITQGLTNALGISPEQAEAMKADPTGAPQQAVQVVTERLQRFVEEIRGSLDYFRTQSNGLSVRGLVLTGGGSLLPGLADRLSETLQLPVRYGEPLASLKIGRVGLDTEQLAAAAPYLPVAVGLALGLVP